MLFVLYSFNIVLFMDLIRKEEIEFVQEWNLLN